jgi:DNA-binding HxlR family transcriptional regulator
LTGSDETRTVAEMIALITPKWVAPIILALEGGPLRYAEIRQQLGPVSAKVLTDTLRRLDHVGVVDRVLVEGANASVGYALTPVGRSLHSAIAALRDWYAVHSHELNVRGLATGGGTEPED